MNDEEVLIRRFVEQDDEGAFEALVRGRLPTLRRLVAAAGRGNPEETDEIMQEVLIRIHGSLAAYRFDAPFGTWMYRIARNASIDRYRKERRLRERERKATPPPGDSGADPEEVALARIRTLELRRLFFRLDEQDRQLLLLREREGLSMEEIARILDLRPGTVKSRLSRARKRARTLYEESEYE